MKGMHTVAKPHECKKVIVSYPVIAFQVKLTYSQRGMYPYVKC